MSPVLRSVHQVEKRLELVKQVSHSTHKKLTACLQGQQGVDVEKRSVRSPSVSLPVCLSACIFPVPSCNVDIEMIHFQGSVTSSPVLFPV